MSATSGNRQKVKAVKRRFSLTSRAAGIKARNAEGCRARATALSGTSFTGQKPAPEPVFHSYAGGPATVYSAGGLLNGPTQALPKLKISTNEPGSQCLCRCQSNRKPLIIKGLLCPAGIGGGLGGRCGRCGRRERRERQATHTAEDGGISRDFQLPPLPCYNCAAL